MQSKIEQLKAQITVAIASESDAKAEHTARAAAVALLIDDLMYVLDLCNESDMIAALRERSSELAAMQSTIEQLARYLAAASD